MGQAWCKEKTSKAQDSKSPLDRVFVRCAHRIYPGLKEEGSVLGGATQRVTSSEIGYAGSPPREVLARGRSIDSVDRPFHPSDWVDVNLEVPSTPRPSPVLTNLTADTSLYPANNQPPSNDSNAKSTTPVPPPRRRKKNKGRPLPPKPDETSENCSSNSKRNETGDEPLYSSVKSPKSSGDEQDAEEFDKSETNRCTEQESSVRRTKEIYEHKVNGTGKIISSDVVSGKRTSRADDKKTVRTFESNNHHRKVVESDEYQRFANSRTSKDSSTPNREDKRRLRTETSKQMKDTSGNVRTKNYSTVSLPNYDELDVARHRTTEVQDGGEEKTKSRRPVRSSTGSLPAESFLSPFSEKTSVRLEDYIQGAPDIMSPYQLLEKLDCGQASDFVKYETASETQDWELGGIGNCESDNRQRESSFEAIAGTNEEHARDEDVVDFSKDNERRSPIDSNVSTSSIYLRKPEAFGKASSPALGELEYSEVDPNRSRTRHSETPTHADSCGPSLSAASTTSKEPFYLDEDKHRSALASDANGGSCRSGEHDQSSQSRRMFARSLSNESEPNEEPCETKDIKSDLIRSISEESLPKEMLEDQVLDRMLDEKLAKNVHNSLKKSLDDWKTRTPPPSPEPKKPDHTDFDHSTLLNVLKEEAAEESNLSSMTPSLTELEAALSDMLEKEDTHEGSKDEHRMIEKNVGAKSAEQLSDQKFDQKFDQELNQNLDQKFDQKFDQNLNKKFDQIIDQKSEQILRQESEGSSPGEILKDKKPANVRKVSFCSWEEAVAQSAIRNDQEFTERALDSDNRTVCGLNEDFGHFVDEEVMYSMDHPPEKPSRLNRSLEDPSVEMPTPPKRKHKSLTKKDSLLEQNGSACSNDRLI